MAGDVGELGGDKTRVARSRRVGVNLADGCGVGVALEGGCRERGEDVLRLRSVWGGACRETERGGRRRPATHFDGIGGLGWANECGRTVTWRARQ